jgi:DnaJ like chaperone protein
MAWWGTLIGGALGYVFAGPLGALVGAALSGNFDRGISMGDRIDAGYGANMGVGEQQRVQLAFFTTTFSVMGHIAKADGHVSKAEIRAAEDIMSQMQLSAEQRKAAIKLFDQGKAADFPFEEVLRQFKQECHRRTSLVQMFIEIQIATALSDGKVDAGEKRVLYRIGEILDFSREQIDHLFNIASGAKPSADDTLTLSQAYKILGVEKESSDAEIKKAYRRLMSQHHPDKLVAKGLPEEMIQLATEKTQEIRKAYELVKSKR